MVVPASGAAKVGKESTPPRTRRGASVAASWLVATTLGARHAVAEVVTTRDGHITAVAAIGIIGAELMAMAPAPIVAVVTVTDAGMEARDVNRNLGQRRCRHRDRTKREHTKENLLHKSLLSLLARG